MPLRAMPQLGAPVLVDYLGATVCGTVQWVDGDGRALEVVTDEGATLEFALNRATATFTVDGGQTAPRLRFAPIDPQRESSGRCPTVRSRHG